MVNKILISSNIFCALLMYVFMIITTLDRHYIIAGVFGFFYIFNILAALNLYLNTNS